MSLTPLPILGTPFLLLEGRERERGESKAEVTSSEEGQKGREQAVEEAV